MCTCGCRLLIQVHSGGRLRENMTGPTQDRTLEEECSTKHYKSISAWCCSPRRCVLHHAGWGSIPSETRPNETRPWTEPQPQQKDFQLDSPEWGWWLRRLLASWWRIFHCRINLHPKNSGHACDGCTISSLLLMKMWKCEAVGRGWGGGETRGFATVFTFPEGIVSCERTVWWVQGHYFGRL